MTASIALGGGFGPPHPSQAAMGTAASGGAGRNGGAAAPPSASASLQSSSAERLQRVAAEKAARRSHPPVRQQTAVQHYTQGVCGGTLDAASLGTRAAYVTVVRKRAGGAAGTAAHWFSLGA
ncbi:hypothetical protein D9Q98_004221 [Chlorella vulgaris]|uniref:Uncharacterized protein n=1 Tax=Chlorella vulgaris TaxID=3077 RepID=A0A9D4TRM4_CHLVU|nr:hypothetical protein D9Q98_004221 [Chlorella vulgaris]